MCSYTTDEVNYLIVCCYFFRNYFSIASGKTGKEGQMDIWQYIRSRGDDVYRCDYSRRGRAIVINQQEFTMRSVSSRPGSQLDALEMARQLNRLQFDVTTFRNQTCQQLKDVMSWRERLNETVNAFLTSESSSYEYNVFMKQFISLCFALKLNVN